MPVAERAQQIKRLLDTHREFSGGHSPIPRRAINANTLDAVRPSLDTRDADALIELTLDDAVDVRAASLRLLADLDAQADQHLRARMNAEADKKRRDRLEAALLELKVVRATAATPSASSSERPP